MPEMANLVYNMYMHMIQTSQKHRQVLTVHFSCHQSEKPRSEMKNYFFFFLIN